MNSALSSLFACATGTLMFSHWSVTPGVAFTPFFFNHLATLSVASLLGVVSFWTCKSVEGGGQLASAGAMLRTSGSRIANIAVGMNACTHLRLGKPVAVVLAGRVANVEQLLNKGFVVRLERNAQAEHLGRVRGAARLVPRWGGRAPVVEVERVRCGRAQREREEGKSKQACCNHLSKRKKGEGEKEEVSNGKGRREEK